MKTMLKVIGVAVMAAVVHFGTLHDWSLNSMLASGGNPIAVPGPLPPCTGYTDPWYCQHADSDYDCDTTETKYNDTDTSEVKVAIKKNNQWRCEQAGGACVRKILAIAIPDCN